MTLINEHETDRLGTFLVDQRYFDHAIQNVLHNAVKYSYPSTRIRVLVKKEGKNLLVYVTSVGVPIPESERERIFWDRERGTAASEYDPIGTGQGLYLARQILCGFGGDLELLEAKPASHIARPKNCLAAEETTFKLAYPEAFE